MIYRITLKLAKKIKVQSLQPRPADANLYRDWSAHIFTAARTQYILVSNTASLYSVLIPGKGITTESSFSQKTASAIEIFLEEDGIDFIFKRFISSDTGGATFAKTFNRSVTGSMNDLVYQAQADLEYFAYSLFEISHRLNTCPMSYIGYKHPRDVFTTMIGMDMHDGR